MMIIENAFEIGDFVYLKTDTQQERKLITGLKILPGATILYLVTSGQFESAHYEFEVSGQKDLNLVNE